MRHLAGKVAVITGGGSGLGLAMAHAFAAEGMALVLADIDEEALEAAAEAVDAEVMTYVADVTSYDYMVGLAAASISRFGHVNLLCNNAGVAGFGGVLDMTLDEFRWVIDVDLMGVLHGIKAFLPHMMTHGDAHIVNTASVSGLLTQPGMSAYNAAKFGVVALSESVFYELQLLKSSVGISVLAPAWVQTRIFEADRYRPGATSPQGEIAEIVRPAMVELASNARLTADDVAVKVVEGVKANHFYIVTHKGVLPFIKHRHEDIEMLRNPSVDQGLG
ncbi:MAG: SDR family NAD(P)-dependent oxidoreductase [bacterium]|nr:SDR family NAD(P)-dependent oxidoreductase [bacterium]